mmetsp:Transcript_37046/g.103041  ORF Transcript_37046/g.103041 Transcript_37046/m.103041 type:complete len:268 (-) Transcript_37046:981-1784(-)
MAGAELIPVGVQPRHDLRKHPCPRPILAETTCAIGAWSSGRSGGSRDATAGSRRRCGSQAQAVARTVATSVSCQAGARAAESAAKTQAQTQAKAVAASGGGRGPGSSVCRRQGAVVYEAVALKTIREVEHVLLVVFEAGTEEAEVHVVLLDTREVILALGPELVKLLRNLRQLVAHLPQGQALLVPSFLQGVDPLTDLVEASIHLAEVPVHPCLEALHGRHKALAAHASVETLPGAAVLDAEKAARGLLLVRLLRLNLRRQSVEVGL